MPILCLFFWQGGVSYTHIFKHLGPIGFRDVACTGRETSLSQCPNKTSPDLDNCAFNANDAGVICYNSTGERYVFWACFGLTKYGCMYTTVCFVM